MVVRSPYDPDSGAAGLIDKRLGAAFDTVSEVADHLGEISYVAKHMQSIVDAANGGGGGDGDSPTGSGQQYDVTTFGAKGDGVTNDIVALQACMDALAAAGGGLAYFPGGPTTKYMVNQPLVVPSNVFLWSPGRAQLRAMPGVNWVKSTRVEYRPPTTTNIAILLTTTTNVYPINPSVRNTNIIIDGLTFSYEEYGGGFGSGHAISLIGVDGATIRNCLFYAGPNKDAATGRMGDAIAGLNCKNILVEDCKAYWFRNCAYDFWSSPENITVRRCYAGSVDSLQMANFNPDTEPSNGYGYQPNQAAIGYTLTQCVFEGLGTSSRPCQIERLSTSSTNSYVADVTITHNTFINCYLNLRGDVRRAVIAHNKFRGYQPTNTNILRIGPAFGGTPESILVTHNQIDNPGTLANQFGVIQVQTNSAIVSNNIIIGDTYEGIPLYIGNYRPSHYNNYFQKLGQTGIMRGGFVLENPNDSENNSRACVGWTDTNGNLVRMYMNGDFWGFYTDDGTGTPRQILSMQSGTVNSQLTVMVPTVIGSTLRISIDNNLSAAGSTQANALALLKNFNVVTTVAAGQGVRLQAGTTTSQTGLRVTVWNLGANRLKVYPPTSGAIDTLGTNVPDIILPGRCKVYVAATTTQYYTESSPAPRTTPGYSVLDYFAFGDGTTDDTAAIQACFNAAAAAGYAAHLPKGTYICEGLTIPSGLKGIVGDGADFAILKRKNSGTARSILQGNNLSDFTISDIGLDGNKANQTVGASNLVLIGCSDFRLLRIQTTNAKNEGGGYGCGILIHQSPATNTTGRELLISRCEAYDNGNQGLAITQTGDNFTIDGGVYSSNGAGGIHFYDQAITPAADSVSNLSIRGVRAERNTGSGISVLGFFVSGLSGARTYGHGSDPAYGVIVDGCQANSNTGYGIFVQATGLSITSNVCRANGTSSEAGICANADQGTISNNLIDCGAGHFGIDAGGCRYVTVADNTVLNSPHIGINIGATEYVQVRGNTIVEAAWAAIYCPRNDSGQYWFPWDSVGNIIESNTIINTIDTARYGILVTGLTDGMFIRNNQFKWTDNTAYNAIRAVINSGGISGNFVVGNVGAALTMNVAASLVLPEWADEFNINTDTTPITTISTRTQQLTSGQVVACKVTARGSGYTADFPITASGGGGTGFAATGRVTQDGRLAAIEITNAGTGYSSSPTLDLSAGAGTGATATATANTPILSGRTFRLLAFGTAFRITSGSTINLPAPVGTTVTVGIRGALTLRGTEARYYPVAFASGDGSVFPTRITLAGGVILASGSGTPEGVLTAPVGSQWHRTDGGAGTSFYVKESGTGNTGWVAK